MFELDEIMHQRESKLFAELLNSLLECKHMASDIAKLQERVSEDISEDINNPIAVIAVESVTKCFFV